MTLTFQPTGWTTAAELDFVEQLASRKRALPLLRGYLAGMAKRTEFSFDPNAVLFVARERLALLERKLAA
ncbi:conserved protein of unknown function [Burkholderia multivorans]